jgi:ribosomal protein L37AE/L43A
VSITAGDRPEFPNTLIKVPGHLQGRSGVDVRCEYCGRRSMTIRADDGLYECGGCGQVVRVEIVARGKWA